jgi:hypothetical protein
MRRKFSGFIASAIALLLSVGALPLTAAAQADAPPARHYTMIDLTPTGATTATAVGLSGAQQFGNAGFPSSDTPGTTENHAVLWTGDANTFTDLGVGTATAVGDGQQVGFTSFGYAALWTGTPESIVYLNPAGWNTSAANGVGGGQQVGVANQQRVCAEKKGGCGSGTYTVFQPFLWTGTAASAVNLNPAGSGESMAYAVAGGQQVGYAFSFQHAMLWTGSAASAVDLHPAAYTSSQARATNGVQQAGFGWVNTPAQIARKHALVWSGSAASVVDLNQFMPLGFNEAAAAGIDATGEVIGVLTNKGAGSYAGTFTVAASPQSITVTSDLGGAASRAVTLK